VGSVDDAVETLAGARVAVAPLLAGSGTRLKIIEAWAAGVPVVSTTVGAEGLDATHDRDLLVADTALDFAQAILRLLASEELCSHLAANARQHFERSLNWTAAWSHLEAAGY
jgi:glycosyltransferase involved in cell wall biosynthesis